MAQITNFLPQERTLRQAEIEMDMVGRCRIRITCSEVSHPKVAYKGAQVRVPARKANAVKVLQGEKNLLKDSPVLLTLKTLALLSRNVKTTNSGRLMCKESHLVCKRVSMPTLTGKQRYTQT